MIDETVVVIEQGDQTIVEVQTPGPQGVPGQAQDISGKADTTYVDAQDAAVATVALNGLQAHATRTDNPHATTKAQVGLGNVDNTSDANKPVSTAHAAALALKANDTSVVHLAGSEQVTGFKQLAEG